MSSIAAITNNTGTSFSHPFRLSPTPTTVTFLAHPDLRVPSIVALSFLLLASVRRAGRMIITERNWSAFRRWSWFGLRSGAEGEDDDEKRLRETEAGGERGRGVGGLRGVERWRGKMFGAGGEDVGVERDQGRQSPCTSVTGFERGRGSRRVALIVAHRHPPSVFGGDRPGCDLRSLPPLFLPLHYLVAPLLPTHRQQHPLRHRRCDLVPRARRSSLRRSRQDHARPRTRAREEESGNDRW
jgi:hypothetical protein